MWISEFLWDSCPNFYNNGIQDQLSVLACVAACSFWSGYVCWHVLQHAAFGLGMHMHVYTLLINSMYAEVAWPMLGLCKVSLESKAIHDICRGLINLPGWCWAEIQQFALVGSSSSLHSEACNALGASDGVIHSRISQEVVCFWATTNHSYTSGTEMLQGRKGKERKAEETWPDRMAKPYGDNESQQRRAKNDQTGSFLGARKTAINRG